MIEVRALRSFEHSGRRVRGDRFHVTEKQAAQLAFKGLVAAMASEVESPPTADGEPSSASPAAPASPQATSSVSAGGAKKRGRPKKVPEASS